MKASALIIVMGRVLQLKKHSGSGVGSAGGGNSRGCGKELGGAGMSCSSEWN